MLTFGTRSEVTVDDSYLVEAIVDPNVDHREGLQRGYDDQGLWDRLLADDIQAIIKYIKSLGQ